MCATTTRHKLKLLIWQQYDLSVVHINPWHDIVEKVEQKMEVSGHTMQLLDEAEQRGMERMYEGHQNQEGFVWLSTLPKS